MSSQRSLDDSSSDTPNHRSGADPNEFPTGLTTSCNTPVSASLAIAVAFIDTHAAESLSAGTIASVANLSMWESQRQFLAHFGVTPLQYVRQLRLEGVRAELGPPTPGTDVRIIARRWGFAHLGRFTNTYFDHFGEAPVRSN
ncbi:helix-turn-helix domain-containing protein [Curtobacterium sp. VKM Ac-1393]|uniref:helix-turn-helix domain-containing protein n=1 Tax=Curtobacterium sp. VKM Ac-1393 TaxID=2783814 RepID=UPI00188A348F|nr:helix-turn-helix domain-containing protein [Curtobacterium sp. VKM Ac-1393]MBF4609397.1 AraC family transcriptional regulator [Curtobacterium sp. VKM Ac-1393]